MSLFVLVVVTSLFILRDHSERSLTRNADNEPEVVVVVDPDRRPRFVSAMCFDSRRLGNLMFNYASLLGVARRNKMVAVMPRFSNWSLPAVFDLQVN
jgi:hypothetical protein